MTGRRTPNAHDRAAIFWIWRGRCHLCGEKIKGGADWQADHRVPRWSSGSDHLSEYAPAHTTCHLQKTRLKDTPAAAKSKRLTASQEAFRTAILAKDAPDDAKPTNAAQRSKIKASWPKGRKLQSRGFNK